MQPKSCVSLICTSAYAIYKRANLSAPSRSRALTVASQPKYSLSAANGDTGDHSEWAKLSRNLALFFSFDYTHQDVFHYSSFSLYFSSHVSMHEWDCEGRKKKEGKNLQRVKVKRYSNYNSQELTLLEVINLANLRNSKINIRHI